MFKKMLAYVLEYKKDHSNKNPYIIYLSGEHTDFVSFNTFTTMVEYYSTHDNPIIIPINPPEEDI